MKSVEEDGYKYWGILEYNEVLHAEMKISLKNKYHGSDYGSEHLGCISLTKAELESIDRKTQKQMTIYGMPHPRA